MFKKTICGFGLLVLVASFLSSAANRAAAQEKVKNCWIGTKLGQPTHFLSDPAESLSAFKVELDQTRTVTGVSVFREGGSSPVQTLPACKDGLTLQLHEYDETLELLEHAHLGTKVYCIYVWDNRSARFRYVPEILEVNPVPHPKNRTGNYADSTYRWIGVKLELIEKHSRLDGSDDPRCGFTDYCDKLVRGEMITTMLRPVWCGDSKPDPPLVCPTSAMRLKRSPKHNHLRMDPRYP